MSSKEYQKIISNFYVKYFYDVNYIAKKIIKQYKYLPLEVEDLVSHTFLKLLSEGIMLEFVNSKISIEQFIFSRIKFYMWNYCNKFLSKKRFAILNNYKSIEDENGFSCNANHYFDHQFNFYLSDEEFNVLYSIKVDKLSRKTLARELHLSINKIRKIELDIFKKIK